jgi:hypothetical protein
MTAGAVVATLAVAVVSSGFVSDGPSPRRAALPLRPSVGSVSAPSPKPRDGAEAVLDAFAQRRLVAIGEIHGSEAQHRFFRRLINDPRFSRTVDDIVVEFGNARYQRVADRYVAGEEVQFSQLRQVWGETTQRPSGVWESPLYASFFRMVRAMNKRLPAARRIRVLLGDPPIDWATIRTCHEPAKDWRRPACIDYWYQRRDSHYANVVISQVLAKSERALLIAGGAHFFRPPPRDTESLIGIVEARYPRSVFVVLPYMRLAIPQPRVDRLVSRWRPETIASLKHTWVGALPARVLFGPDEPSTPEQPRFPNPLAHGMVSDRLDAFLKIG